MNNTELEEQLKNIELFNHNRQKIDGKEKMSIEADLNLIRGNIVFESKQIKIIECLKAKIRLAAFLNNYVLQEEIILEANQRKIPLHLIGEF